ncbi:electron transport complex, RnfABCDGE type, B subunit [Tolumonas auensis DSM 9187]|jgi:electron transport complex protein RnfB|uniref:Ion-translocating oxidoreductase complex subunit B n=1 Tax=Tolumonas auensis (strain DSM 9187 / NBRC 110442 / TA 4) TaxID=595494 RepID=C4L958_TOLAT|nr:RnfABCDGE type electron transport complex subunit B [Tolumonas auensis]ACQ93928.1 electron transport complex, RnfABCDGE type, B subunit [Tolumonas auensis DSM 9187]
MLTLLYLLAIPLIAAGIGYALGYAAIHLKVEGDPLVDEISALLPNGQCGQCGYPGCTQAAKAMACGEAAPDVCPPGGDALAQKIAAVLGVSLDSSGSKGPQVAAIDMDGCDGCGRCIKQCSYDAIVGATRQLHGVIADACTGCGACVAVCPHNGISLYPDPAFMSRVTKPGVIQTATLEVKNA